MAMVLLHFPAFFTIEGEGRDRAHVGAPLLLPALEARGPSAQAGSTRLIELVRVSLQHEMELCGPLSAIPDTWEERVADLEVSARGGRGARTLRYVLVQTHGQHWAIFPRLGPAVLPLSADTAPVGAAVQEALDALVRARKPDDATLQSWDDQPGDRVVPVRLRADVRWPPIEPDPSSLLALLGAGGPGKIHGALELPRVASSLKQRYPDRLLDDRVHQPLADELSQALFEREPGGVVVVGAPGSGRTTLIHAALRRQLDRATRATGPDTYKVPDLWLLDPNRVIAGQSVVGAWQRRFQAILERLVNPGPHRDRPDVLYVDNPIALASVGRARGSDLTLARMLRPWLEQRRLPVVLEATPEGWARLEELDRPLCDLFRVIRPPTRSRGELVRIVASNLPLIEAETGATLPLPALRTLLTQAERQPGERVLPGSALDVLWSLARTRQAPLSPAEIQRAYAEESGLHPSWVDPGSARMDPSDLRARIAARLAGQPAAVDFILRALLTLRHGLARPGRPIASALLIGPTGVGKTETARVLASLLFQREGHLLRFDMNELVDDTAVHRLLGDLQTEGLLTSRVRHRPVSVVLFDEVEKAHPAVLDLLLQVLDEGRLTDGRGQRADFQRTVVLMTSNVGAAELSRTPGYTRDAADLAASYRSAAQKAFRPEFLNRIDQIIAFSALSPADLRQVAALQVRALLQREGFKRRTIFLDLAPAELDRLASAAAGSTGARALKRAIEAEIAAPFSSVVLDHPPETPLLLRALPGGGLDVRAVPYTARRVSTALDAAPDAAQIQATVARLMPRTPLVASAGPQGTVLHASTLAQHVQTRLFDEPWDEDRAWSRRDDDADDTAGLTNAQVRRAVGRRGKVHWRRHITFRPDWAAAQSFRSVRAWLLAAMGEAAAEPTAPGEDRTDAAGRAIAALQLRAHEAHGETSFWIHVRPIATPPEDLWWRTALYVVHLERVVERYGGRASLWQRLARGWTEDRELVGCAERALRITGTGLEALLDAEVGVHVWWIDDAPALGLQVIRRPDGPPADPAWPPPPEIVRLYLGATDDGAITVQRATDLRLERAWVDLYDVSEDGLAPFALEAL